MKIKNPFNDLTKFEKGLWMISVCMTVLSFLISGGGDILSMTATDDNTQEFVIFVDGVETATVEV